MVIPNVGLVAMPAEQYHADPCATPSLSSSIAHTLVSQSPAHAWLKHPRLGGKPSVATAAMNEGTLIHELLLRDEGELSDRLVVVNADDWRTKSAQGLRALARAEGKLAVLARDIDTAREASVHIMARLIKRGIRLSGASEVAAFWVEHASDGTPVQCRGLFDHVLIGDGLIYDLKKSKSAHPKALRKTVEQYGYHVQATAYRRALEQIDPKLAGRVAFRWLFVESKAPYGVTVAEPRGSMRVLGDACWSQAVDTWAHCVATGEWPAYPDEIVGIEASRWALEDAFFEDDGEDVAA